MTTLATIVCRVPPPARPKFFYQPVHYALALEVLAEGPTSPPVVAARLGWALDTARTALAHLVSHDRATRHALLIERRRPERGLTVYVYSLPGDARAPRLDLPGASL